MKRRPLIGWAKLHNSSCSWQAATGLSLVSKRPGWSLSALVLSACLLTAVFQVIQYAGTLRSRYLVLHGKPSMAFEQRESLKAALPKTKMFESWTTETLQQKLPVWVVSLKRSKDRRQAMIKGLEEAGVTNYQLIDAVDAGQGPLAATPAELNKYANAWKRHMWYKRQKHYSSKIAVDLSHYRLLERIAATNSTAVILEDDVQLTGKQWLPDLLKTLQELPHDWDVLYLDATSTQHGRAVSPHVLAIRWTAGTVGYVATPSFAHKVLRAASNPRINKWVDLLYGDLAVQHEVQAYLAQPRLVSHQSFPTTIVYDAGNQNVTMWERLWKPFSGH